MRTPVAIEGARRVAVDHARQLVKQQDQPKPALRALQPLIQTTRQGLLDQIAEALLRLDVVVLAKPQRALLVSDVLGTDAPSEPPLQ
ncbi:hypothetical protein D3C71_1858940 [compost metagenome]